MSLTGNIRKRFADIAPGSEAWLAEYYDYLLNRNYTVENREKLVSAVERVRKVESAVQAIENGMKSRKKDTFVFSIASGHTLALGNMGAFGLLASWALRAAGYPVLYSVCERGMFMCPLGSNRNGNYTTPPCRQCIDIRHKLYPKQYRRAMILQRADFISLRHRYERMDWDDLVHFVYDGIDIGKMCLNSLRWVVRRCNPQENEFTRHMLIDYILSAISITRDTRQLVRVKHPEAIVVSNGSHYPEAVVRHVADEESCRCVSYELGFLENSAFFSHDIAVRYQFDIPNDFVMGDKENSRLDEYMNRRRQGKFDMGGHKFWSEMMGVPDSLKEKVNKYKDVVTVFTNIGYDTSQSYSDLYFENMFDWLEQVMILPSQYKDTLFVIRAHPDEVRKGRPSNESVAGFMSEKRYTGQENVVFIPGDQLISSYALLDISKFCMVYSSSIGLEAAAVGVYVLPGGWTRYRVANSCYLTRSKEDFINKAMELIEHEGTVKPPEEWVKSARRFFYYSLYNASLDFSMFIDQKAYAGFPIKEFDAELLRGDRTESMNILCKGIAEGCSFTVPI
jgi:hypothetical protein